MKRIEQLFSRMPSPRATMAAAMALFTVAAGPISQTLAVARVDAADSQNQNGSEFKLVFAGAWDESAAEKSTEAGAPNKNDSKPAKHDSLVRPLSEQWDTAKIVHFSAADMPADVVQFQHGLIALVVAEPAPIPVYAPPHAPIRPGRAPPQLS